jgi:hypothetical protein
MKQQCSLFALKPVYSSRYLPRFEAILVVNNVKSESGPLCYPPLARVTTRLFQMVQIIGLATGGRLGMRVTDR